MQRYWKVSSIMIFLLSKSRSFVPLRRGLLSVAHGRTCLSTLSGSPQWTTDQVRSTFIDFFKDRDHVMQPSSPCAPLNDPTLLFTNAGMNQFKPIFLGQVDPNTPLASLRRACNSQKCIRAGGKHNDLEDVGRDTYHHTFFEMLGTWSFGDYFKEQAIDYAWILLTEVYKLPPDRLYATYFEGDESVPEDVEAKEFWLKYLPPDRVIGSSAKDNFWEMGETGPCGPCTEIHYDRIGGRNAASLVNMDDPDVIEIWNVVFIQFNRDTKGLSLLPQKHIDTGMGLERLVSILQGKSSNYDIDAFQKILDKIAEFSTIGPYEGKLGAEDPLLKDTAYRAISDHIRTLCFAIADGALPNNEGRGYVLRRILRRATRYGQQILQAPPGFFHKLIPVVVETFGDAYPELMENEGFITEVIREEEEAFSKMLSRGIKYFSELEKEIKESGGKLEVPGDKAFFLYDSLGFPVDLTQLMAEEAGLKVDIQGFHHEMESQKERSRQARVAAKSGSTPQLILQAEETAALAELGVYPTDDSSKYQWDVEVPAKIMSIFSQGGFCENQVAQEGDVVGIVMNKSSFYAEAGGQEADLGSIRICNEEGDPIGDLEVLDVQSYAGYLLHTAVVKSGYASVGSDAVCRVDYERRRQVAPNHSMTHVLNAALREVLGANVEQRGSLCNDEKLRFDFSYNKAMTPQQLEQTEQYCKQAIDDSLPVTSQVLPLAEAKTIEGVRAVFGEVYPDPVRVVSVGKDASIEFCGGTHVGNTAEAGEFVLVEETAVAKGIRRITAVTQDQAESAIAEADKFAQIVSDLECRPTSTAGLDKEAGAIRNSLDEAFMSAVVKAELRSRIEFVQKAANDAKKEALAKKVESVLKSIDISLQEASSRGENVVVLDLDVSADAKASQKIANSVRKMSPGTAFMGISEEEKGSGGKVMVVAVVPTTMVGEGLKANEWVKATLESCGGRGGGKAESAQGQAPQCTNVDNVIAGAMEYAKSKMP
eukprot:Nitzschia sp. Nitz4//scaffold28_size193895//107196//110247//NITZ4_001664-RA/size193895-augustus-gene-0.310-mRNA-1//-1//CDS//3329545979//7368//frame0